MWCNQKTGRCFFLLKTSFSFLTGDISLHHNLTDVLQSNQACRSPITKTSLLIGANRAVGAMPGWLREGLGGRGWKGRDPVWTGSSLPWQRFHWGNCPATWVTFCQVALTNRGGQSGRCRAGVGPVSQPPARGFRRRGGDHLEINGPQITPRLIQLAGAEQDGLLPGPTGLDTAVDDGLSAVSIWCNDRSAAGRMTGNTDGDAETTACKPMAGGRREGNGKTKPRQAICPPQKPPFMSPSSPPPPKGESLTRGVALSIGNSSSSNSNTYNNNICSHAISVTCHSSKHCIAKPKGIVSRYCLLALPQQQQKRRQACPSACHTRLKLLKQCSCLLYGMRDVSIWSVFFKHQHGVFNYLHRQCGSKT